MKVKYTADAIRFSRMNTAETRETFLIDELFKPDELVLIYCEVDRAIAGSAVPVKKQLELSSSKELASDYFAERREIGVINIGESGKITVDGTVYNMANKDCLYIGRGSKQIVFSSDNATTPAQFYLVSFPAHQNYPTKQACKKDATARHLGTVEDANKRTIYQYIHAGGIQSCQLVMGFTELETGCVWNTMPPHTHERRMEVYLYFDMNENTRVFHLMGKPQETRHIVVADKQAIMSPSWSIHSGVGTGAYSFIWGMGGENQAFDDMDGLKIGDLK